MAGTSGRDSAAADSLGSPKDELYGEPVTFLGRCAARSCPIAFQRSSGPHAFLLILSF